MKFWKEVTLVYEQLDIFSFIKPQKVFKPGDYIEKKFCGRQITFEEITKNVGNFIALDISTAIHEMYKVILIEKIRIFDGKKRMLVYYDGHEQRGFINEVNFSEEMTWTQRAFELNYCG